MIQRKILPALAIILIMASGMVQTVWALGAGDIYFIGWNSDGGDRILFVTFVDITGGTKIYFRDDEYNSGWVDGNEGAISWTAPVGGITAGIVVEIDSCIGDPPTASTGSCAKEDASFDIANGENACYIYTANGWDTGPFTFIAAFCNQTGFDVYLNGTGLTDGTEAFSWGNKDNWRYKGKRTFSSVAEAKDSIQDSNEWENTDGSGDQSFTFDTTHFSFDAEVTYPDSGDVVINEIMYDSKTTDQEWVELFNRTRDTIDIGGCILTDDETYPTLSDEGKLTVPASTSIPPLGYVVLTDAAISEIDGEIVCTKTGSWALNNDGDNLALFSAASGGKLIDGSLGINYPDESPGNSGYSIEKVDQYSLWSGHWREWEPAVDSFENEHRRCTPGKRNSVALDVVINEIMYDPSFSKQGEDQYYEWFELWNLSSDTVNVGIWKVKDNIDSITIPSDTKIPPGNFLVMAADSASVAGCGAYSDNLGGDARLMDYDYANLQLGNNGDWIVLQDINGTIVDSVHYYDTWGGDNNGPSLELYNPALDNNIQAGWAETAESLGTPGDTNTNFYWYANASKVWDSTVTWWPKGVPNKNYDARINSGRTVTIRDAGGDAYCKDLIIDGTLTHSGGSDDTLFLYGDWKNDGAFNRGAAVTFKGTGKKEINKNTSADARERFHNLVIDLSSVNDTIQMGNSDGDSLWANHFAIKGGTFIQKQQGFKVDSNFTVSGGRYVMLHDWGEIDVAGDVSISSNFIFEQPNARIQCAGNLSISGDNIFTSENGQVRMDGNIDYNTISMSGSGNFLNFLKIEATSSADSMDSVVALTDINAKRVNITTGVYSPGGHKTTVTDTVLFVGTNGTLRMKNSGDTLDLNRGLWLSRGPTYQAKTDITDGVILCDGPFRDSTDAGFDPSGGVVIFDGTTNSNIKLGSESYFNNIVINKSSGSVILDTDIAVKGNFRLESGSGTFSHNNKRVTFNKGGLSTVTVTGEPEFHSLTVNGTILDVDSTDITSYISVTNDTTFTNWGAIQKTQKKRVDENGDTVFYDGLGREALVFTPTVGTIDSAKVYTRFGSMIPQDAFGSGCAAGITSAKRYYNISPKNSGTATLKMHYYDSERGDTPANEMLQVRWDGSHWQLLPSDSTTRGGTGNPYWCQVTGVNDFSLFTLGGPGALAVELIFLYASPGPGYITLLWTSSSETQNSKWNLFKAEENCEEYRMIAEIRGQGTVPNQTEYSYQDTLVTPKETYIYILAAIGENGDTTWHGPVSAVAEFYILLPCFYGIYPNPFRTETNLKYAVPGLVSGSKSKGEVYISLKVYDIGGRLVGIILDGKERPGIYKTPWYGKDNNNNFLPGGVYFIRFETNGFIDTKKVILIR